MSAVMQQTDPKLPGSVSAPTVSQADDQTLADALKADLAHVEQTLAKCMFAPCKPDRDGFAPPEWHKQASASRAQHANQASVQRAEGRIKAIRAELERREAARKAQADAEQADAQRRLEGILADAPAQAQDLAEQAEQAMPSVERIRQFVQDIRTMAKAAYLPPAHNRLLSGVAIAADSLKTDRPELAPLPEDMPSKSELDEVLALMMGRHGGFETVVESVKGADFHKAADLARKA